MNGENIKAIINARLLYPSKEGYKDILGLSYDIVCKNLCNDDYINKCYQSFNQSCKEQSLYDIDFIYNSYVGASRAVVNDSLWSRKQMESRKQFCRWLFARAYLKELKGVDKEFNIKKDDEFSRRNFLSDDGHEIVDICFLLLLSYKIIRPFCDDGNQKVRFSDYDTDAQLDGMICLLEDLKRDMPLTGVFENWDFIDIQIALLQKRKTESKPLSVVGLWNVLDSISSNMAAASSPSVRANSKITIVGYHMDGIWIDDYDNGQTRFWMFPRNRRMAFCYTLKDNDRKCSLRVYEYCFYMNEVNGKVDELCNFITDIGNRECMQSPAHKISDKEFVRINYKNINDDKTGKLAHVEFWSEINRIPDWMTWRSFTRLSSDDERHIRFRSILKNLYTEDEMTSKVELFVNNAWLPNSLDAFFAMDSDNIYLSDFRMPDHGFKMECVNSEKEIYYYYPDYGDNPLKVNFSQLEISEKHPLYILPCRPESLNKDGIRDMVMNKRLSENEEYEIRSRCEQLKQILTETVFGDQISIYRLDTPNSEPIVCFNKFGFSISLRTLQEYTGMRTVTKRCDFFI